MSVREWTQRELEDLFPRKDLHQENVRELREDIAKLEQTMEWWTRLVIVQGVMLVAAIALFVLERVAGG